MSYIALTDIEGKIPAPFLTQALDDDGDGVMDAHEQVLASASKAVDALLGGRFTVPFSAPLPAIVADAATVFFCEQCYQRRGFTAEANPWAAQADAMRKRLDKIASGMLPLSPTVVRANASGTLISEPSTTFDAAGRRLS